MPQHNVSDTKPYQPVQITPYLKGADFPASKDELLECAEENNAPDDVICAIRSLRPSRFKTLTDITKSQTQNYH
ncbi:MAG: DUF2795 domain-containing protein [Alphaproteobacteria bacterium]|nr:MAG: DUF2795 domain-containing protein [Alphaproteobacteria bacterium]